jgi:hypothetical protein
VCTLVLRPNSVLRNKSDQSLRYEKLSSVLVTSSHIGNLSEAGLTTFDIDPPQYQISLIFIN